MRALGIGGVSSSEDKVKLESDIATESGIATTIPATQRTAILEQEFDSVDNAKPKARFKLSKGSNRERIAVKAFGGSIIKKRKGKF